MKFCFALDSDVEKKVGQREALDFFPITIRMIPTRLSLGVVVDSQKDQAMDLRQLMAVAALLAGSAVAQT